MFSKKKNELKNFFLYVSIFLFVIFGTTILAETSEKNKLYENLSSQTKSVDVLTENTTLNSELISSHWNQEPTQNLRVSNLGGDQAIPKIVATANGDFYVIWFSNPDDHNYDVRMQRYDVNGNALWQQNGILISKHPSMTWITDYALTLDNEDNAILVFHDVRNDSNNIYAYKISPEGQFIWGKDGLPLSNNEYFEAPAPTSVVTSDHFNCVWVRETTSSSVIVLQKLMSNGEFIWEDEGVVIEGDPKQPLSQPVIVSGGSDRLIVVWGIEEQPGSQVMNIYAQKIDEKGQFVWNDSQPILLADSVPFYIFPSLLSDGNGGAFVSWYTTELKSFVQHLDANGEFLMSEAGATVADSGSNLQISPELQYVPETQELYVFWLETDANQKVRGISGQKMSSTGDLFWSENGRNFVELSPPEIGMITPKLVGKDVLVFYAEGNPENILETQLEVMLINSDGELVWGDESLIFSSVPSNKFGLEVDVIGDREWIGVWTDERDGNRDIYMQNYQLPRRRRDMETGRD